MHVVILASEPEIGRIWARHLERQGADVTVADGQNDAINILRSRKVEVLVAEVVLSEGSAIAVADFANYRQPGTKVILVSNGNFFSDGSVFAHVTNACTVVPSKIAPSDLGAMVEHYGRAGP